MSFFRVISVYFNHFLKVIKEDILCYFQGETIRDTGDFKEYLSGNEGSLRNRRKQKERMELENKLKMIKKGDKIK